MKTKEMYNGIRNQSVTDDYDHKTEIHRSLEENSRKLEEVEAELEEDEGVETMIYKTEDLAEEIEDFMLSPEISADLKDLVSSLVGSEEIPNLNQKVFGKMLSMDSESFLKLMFLIIDQDPEAETIVQELIDEIKSGITDSSHETEKNDPESVLYGNEDLHQMSQREIRKLIDEAIEEQDWSRARDLARHLKESKRSIFEERIRKSMNW